MKYSRSKILNRNGNQKDMKTEVQIINSENKTIEHPVNIHLSFK